MTIEEIVAVIANSPKSIELQIIEDTCNSIKDVNVEVKNDLVMFLIRKL